MAKPPRSSSRAPRTVEERFLRARQPNQALLSKNDLTLMQTLASHALYANAQNELDRPRHAIPLRDLRELIGFRQKSNAALQDVLEALQTYKIQWGRLDDSLEEHQRWGSIPWLGPVIVRDGMVYYEYSETLKALLREATWTRLDLTILREFRRKHGLTLYTVAKKYQRVRTTGWKPIEWWRELFGVNTAHYAEDFAQFKRDVLKVAENEVALRSDVRVEILQRGRPVRELKLLIYANEDFVHPLDRQGQPAQKALVSPPEDPSPQDLDRSDLELIGEEYVAEINERFGLSVEKARTLLEQRGIEVIADALVDLRHRQDSGFTPDVSWAAYAAAVLARHEIVHLKRAVAASEKRVAAQSAQRGRETERERARLVDEHRRRRKQVVAEAYTQLGSAQRAQVLAQFRAEAEPQGLLAIYERLDERLDPARFDPWEHSGLHLLWERWFVDHHGLDFPSLEDYITQHTTARAQQLSLLGESQS